MNRKVLLDILIVALAVLLALSIIPDIISKWQEVL